MLAGSAQSRRWNHPVDVYDIARGALSEVEGYERVLVDTDDDLEIHGDVVADLTHLLAELVENALAFSSPETAVEVVARKNGNGSEIIVSDRGVGMTDVQLAEANERIRTAAHDTETPSEFLGHYVVGRLAARHGVVVELTHGESSGTVATVRLPTGAVVPGADELVEEFAAAVATTEAPPESLAAMGDPVTAETIAEQPTRVPVASPPQPADVPVETGGALDAAPTPNGLNAIPRTARARTGGRCVGAASGRTARCRARNACAAVASDRTVAANGSTVAARGAADSCRSARTVVGRSRRRTPSHSAAGTAHTA